MSRLAGDVNTTAASGLLRVTLPGTYNVGAQADKLPHCSHKRKISQLDAGILSETLEATLCEWLLRELLNKAA